MPIYKIPHFKPVVQTIENGNKAIHNRDLVTNEYKKVDIKNEEDFKNSYKTHEKIFNITTRGNNKHNINSSHKDYTTTQNFSPISSKNNYLLQTNQKDNKLKENIADEGLYESIIEKEVKEQLEREKEVALMRNLNIALEKPKYLEDSSTLGNLKRASKKETDYSPMSSTVTEVSYSSGYLTLENSRLTSPEAPCKNKALFENKLFKKRVMPLEEVEKKTFEPQEESLLEREVRLARQREGSLRRAKGYLLKVHDDPQKVTISTLSKNKNLSYSEQVDGPTNQVKNSQLFATNRLRNEILKDKQRELNLKSNKQEMQNSMKERTNEDKPQNNSHSQKIKYFDTRENMNHQNGTKLKNNSNYYKNVLRNKKSINQDRIMETRMEEEIEECLQREEQLRQQRLQHDGAILP